MTPISKPFDNLLRQRRWLKFSVLSAALAWLITYLILAALSGLISPPPTQQDRSALQILFGGVVFAPLLENLLVVAALQLLRNWFSSGVAVCVMTVIAVCLHVMLASWSGVAALVLFAMMGVSYEAWQPHGQKLAFVVIFLQHALFNLPSTTASAVQVLT